MASTYTPDPADRLRDRRFRGLIDTIFASMGQGLEAIAVANRRAREFERLNELGDARLAAMGLDRRDIARHVVRDLPGF